MTDGKVVSNHSIRSPGMRSSGRPRHCSRRRRAAFWRGHVRRSCTSRSVILDWVGPFVTGGVLFGVLGSLGDPFFCLARGGDWSSGAHTKRKCALESKFPETKRSLMFPIVSPRLGSRARHRLGVHGTRILCRCEARGRDAQPVLRRQKTGRRAQYPATRRSGCDP